MSSYPNENMNTLNEQSSTQMIKKQKTRKGANESNKSSFEAVTTLIKSGNIIRLRSMLASGELTDANMKDVKSRNTLLIVAAEEGQVECLELSIEYGAIINDPTNDSVLYKACENGHIEVVKVLLKHHADPNRSSVPPLNIACAKGHLEIAKILIENGAIVNLADEDAVSALQEASGGGNAKLVEYLISKDAELDRCNSDYWTPLHIAYCKRDFKMMEVLVKHGADVDVHGPGGDEDYNDEDTCLNLACKNGDMEMINFLLAHGADAAAYNHHGRSPFITAYEKGNREVVDLFLQRDVDLNNINCHYLVGDVQYQNKSSPLMFACAKGDITVVKRLLSHGADPNLMRKDITLTDSAVISACRGGHVEVLQVLLDQGVDVNQKDYMGNNSLMFLLYDEEEGLPLPWSGRTIACARLLVEYGLDLQAVNNEGWDLENLAQGDPVLTKLFKYAPDSKPLVK